MRQLKAKYMNVMNILSEVNIVRSAVRSSEIAQNATGLLVYI